MGTRAGVSSHSAIEGSNFELTSGDPGAPVLSSERKGRAIGSGFLVSATVPERIHTRQCRQGGEGHHQRVSVLQLTVGLILRISGPLHPTLPWAGCDTGTVCSVQLHIHCGKAWENENHCHQHRGPQPSVQVWPPSICAEPIGSKHVAKIRRASALGIHLLGCPVINAWAGPEILPGWPSGGGVPRGP